MNPAVVVYLTRGRDQGQWWPLQRAEPQKSATVRCPGCGSAVSLENVTEDVVPVGFACPENCGFAEHVILHDWEA